MNIMGRKPRQNHGLSNHPLYIKWQSMVRRCHVPEYKGYAWYGAKGITVCEEWRTDPKAFIEWSLANGWKPGLDLDKDTLYPGNKVYSPNTCVYIPHRNNMLVVVGRDSGRRTQRLKLSHEDISELLSRKQAGEKTTDLSTQYGVSIGYVNALFRESKR